MASREEFGRRRSEDATANSNKRNEREHNNSCKTDKCKLPKLHKVRLLLCAPQSLTRFEFYLRLFDGGASVNVGVVLGGTNRLGRCEIVPGATRLLGLLGPLNMEGKPNILAPHSFP